VGALNDGVGTLISVNDASTVDVTSTSDAGSSMTVKPIINNMDCTGTVTYNLDWTGTVPTNDLCNRSLTGCINALTGNIPMLLLRSAMMALRSPHLLPVLMFRSVMGTFRLTMSVPRLATSGLQLPGDASPPPGRTILRLLMLVLRVTMLML
jgi:hypothetical protein